MPNKLIAAVVTVILMRWVTRWTGLDLAEIDDNGDVKTLVALGVDAAVASVTGFFVWLVPNVKQRWTDFVKDKWWWPWS